MLHAIHTPTLSSHCTFYSRDWYIHNATPPQHTSTVCVCCIHTHTPSILSVVTHWANVCTYWQLLWKLPIHCKCLFPLVTSHLVHRTSEDLSPGRLDTVGENKFLLLQPTSGRLPYNHFNTPTEYQHHKLFHQAIFPNDPLLCAISRNLTSCAGLYLKEEWEMKQLLQLMPT